jgi:hypothetical protein
MIRYSSVVLFSKASLCAYHGGSRRTNSTAELAVLSPVGCAAVVMAKPKSKGRFESEQKGAGFEFAAMA